MNSIGWLLSVSPFIAFSINCIIQLSLARVINDIAIFVLSGLLVGLVVNILLLIYSLGFYSGDGWIFFAYSFVSLITYFALSFCYWGFLNLNRTSLRIRILRELSNYKTDGLSEKKLLDVYLPQELLNVRLLRLNKKGKIIKNDQNKWQVQRAKASELFILVACLDWLRKIIIPYNSQQA